MARTLRPTAVGQSVTGLALHGCPIDLDEAVIQDVSARGKHLVFALGRGPADLRPRILRVHLGMKGSWHRYRPGERWQRSPDTARVVLGTEDWDYVCFNTRDAELYATPKDAALGVLGRLGPDLLGVRVDLAEILRRARTLPARDADVSSVLLNQRVASGIGNVYRVEILFLQRINPWRRLDDIEDDALSALFASARDQLSENFARGGARVTTTAAFKDRPGGIPKHLRHHVFRRANRPCLRCQHAIAARVHQQTGRHTFWCPNCQPK